MFLGPGAIFKCLFQTLKTVGGKPPEYSARRTCVREPSLCFPGPIFKSWDPKVFGFFPSE